MSIRGRLLGLLTGLTLLAAGARAPAQDVTPLLTLAVSAGYEGLFRENAWLPLRVQAGNDGDDFSGRLVVRPETSGSAFTNTFSVPLDLPSGSRKTVFLYVTARSFATQARVELIDGATGAVAAAQPAALRHVLPQDQLHVVLSGASAGTVDLTAVHAGGYGAFQAHWSLENLPDLPAAYDAIDTLLFSDLDTGALSQAQRAAISGWTAQGGHLIVTGGANWQAAAAGLADLLPLRPAGSRTVSSLDALAALAGANELRGDTVAATGALAADAVLLAAAPDGLPLLARRAYGLGTVDYLTLDPLAQPLRGWAGLGDLWFTLAASRPPVPGWTRGFTNPERAATAVSIIPGYDPLPTVLPLLGFLLLYLLLVGPLNFVVLRRLNRLELAWVTIPLLIAAFTALAWAVGFNLRGTTTTINRLTVFQSWAGHQQAQADGLVGLLSPRRASYTLTAADGSALRPLVGSAQANPFASSIQAGTDIRQAETFQAYDFSVDSSFVSAFITRVPAPPAAISGQAVLFYDPALGERVLRGSVRNASALTLTDAVILAQGATLRLEQPLEPGGIYPFELVLANAAQPAAPAPLERTTEAPVTRIGLRAANVAQSEQTVIDILGPERYEARAYAIPPGRSAAEQEQRLRQLFLSSFIVDQYGSTARGDRAFLAGWSRGLPPPLALEGAAGEETGQSLYLIELTVEAEPPAGTVVIGPPRFVWAALERTGFSSAPANLVMQPGDTVAFRFTPQPGALLAEVQTLRVVADSVNSGRAGLPLEIWDWHAREWVMVELAPQPGSNSVGYSISRPARFLGPGNAVQLRLTADPLGTFLRIERLGVEQTGSY